MVIAYPAFIRRSLALAPLCMLSFMLPLSADESSATEQGPQPSAEEEQRPYLGIQFDRAHDGDGVRVGRVFPNSTASSLGIERNDVITAINGTAIGNASQLQDLINAASVGEDISVSWKRDGEAQEGTAPLASLPRQRLEARQLAELRDNVRTLQAQRAALQGAGDDETLSVAEAMHGLATTLNELPERIEQAAKQFKELYPDGSFTVHIEIDIRTNAKEENPLDISPQQGRQQSTSDDKDEDEEKANEEDDDTSAESEENETADSDQE